MLLQASTLFVAVAAAAAAPAYAAVPSLKVPACPSKGTITYSKTVPDKAAFPKTQVDLCYDKTSINIKFTAYDEINFYYNASYGINDAIYEYEVMETFIARGTNDPQTYLEFEVAPNNVTFNAFIYNPTKVRAPGAPFDRFYIQDPIFDGLTAKTTLDRKKKTWVSDAKIPLGLFNVDEGKAKGEKWRMNFFRTVVAPATFPDQLLGAWSVPDEASFHKTPFFGNIVFV